MRARGLAWEKHGSAAAPYYTAAGDDGARYILRPDGGKGHWRVLQWFKSLGLEHSLSRGHRGVAAAKAAARQHYITTLTVTR